MIIGLRGGLMNKKDDYFYQSCLGLLENYLPPELFEQVRKYMKNETIEDANKYTQADRVYNHLLEHGSITNMQCHLLYGIRHCPSVIRNVKKKLLNEGSFYFIDTEMKKGCNRYGEKTNWLNYILKKKEAV